MYAVRDEDFGSDSESSFEDEDELTRIIPPEGNKLSCASFKQEFI